jgi:outer membrane immunogenic protein
VDVLWITSGFLEVLLICHRRSSCLHHIISTAVWPKTLWLCSVCCVGDVMLRTSCGSKSLVAFLASCAVLIAAPLKAAPAPVYDWTGCYIGAQVGGGFMHDSNVDDSDDPIFHGGGAIAGGQVGCNLQVVQQLVVGIEGEGWWSGLSNPSGTTQLSTTSYPTYMETYQSNSSSLTRNSWDATAVVRLGWAFDRVLLYGKGGVAFGGFTFSNVDNYSYVYTNSGGTNYSYTSSQTGSATLTGIVLGVGLEWAFGGNWIGRVEGDYINFARTNVPFMGSYSYTYTGCTSCYSGTTSGVQTQYVTEEILKFGLSYKFH